MNCSTEESLRPTGSSSGAIPVLLLALVLSFTACDIIPTDTGTGVLVISLSTEGMLRVKTIEPDIDMDVAYYAILGQGPGDASFAEPHVSDSVVVQSSLVPGEWLITVNAYNSNDQLIGTGSATLTVLAGEVLTASIAVGPIEGDGILDIDISWPAGVLESPLVTGTITPVSGTAEEVLFVAGTNSASLTRTLSEGYYRFTISLHDGPDLLWGNTEALRIISSETSNRSYELIEDVNRGGLEITIAADLQNPIEIDFTGAVATLPQGENMTVAATTSGEVDGYQWYLGSQPLPDQTSNRVVIGATLDPGVYWLDLIVTKGPVISSNGIVFEVVAGVEEESFVGWLPMTPEVEARVRYGGAGGWKAGFVNPGGTLADGCDGYVWSFTWLDEQPVGYSLSRDTESGRMILTITQGTSIAETILSDDRFGYQFIAIMVKAVEPPDNILVTNDLVDTGVIDSRDYSSPTSDREQGGIIYTLSTGDHFRDFAMNGEITLDWGGTTPKDEGLAVSFYFGSFE